MLGSTLTLLTITAATLLSVPSLAFAPSLFRQAQRRVATSPRMALMDDMAIALGLEPGALVPDGGRGVSSFTTTGVAKDNTGKRYFYKKGSGTADAAMLKAEYEGVKAMSDTKTIRVPEPLAFGAPKTYASGPFVIFEHLSISGGGDGAEMGSKLAAMHRITSDNGKFGFHIDNTIGATPQCNAWEDTWSDFFIKVSGSKTRSDEALES